MPEPFDCKYCFEPIYEKHTDGKREFFDDPCYTKKHHHNSRAFKFNSELNQLKQNQNSNLTRFHNHDDLLLKLEYDFNQLKRRLTKLEQKFGI